MTTTKPDRLPVPEIWVDVGGTFTDCFVNINGERRSSKVLSHSSVRCRVAVIDENTLRAELPEVYHVDRFFDGCEVRLAGADGRRLGVGRISRFDATTGTIRLERPIGRSAGLPESSLSDGFMEIDAGVESPVLAAKLLLRIPLADPMPPVSVRLGTTRGTNALLTRTGAATALVTTAGFGDLLSIGEQDRPDLFALSVTKPEPLPCRTIEVAERLDDHGNVLTPIDTAELRAQFRQLITAGVESIAICFLHAHVNDVHERIAAQLAREVGFQDVSRSAEVAPLIKVVSRAETTVLDAYLNPILRIYLRRLEKQFGGRDHCRLSIMTSAGNLVTPDHYRGRDSVLSGPAGGVVALGKIAETFGRSAAIGLDMGGTSTDVSRFDHRVGRRFESRVSGVRILTPMMDIHTVAAGGGSICDDDGGRLIVGPASAGSDPGPACYGRGGPLTITDANLLLGRIPTSRFPIPLDRAAAAEQLQQIIRRRHAEERTELDPTSLADGFVQIACAHMAEAVRAVTTAQGSDPRTMSLVGFGGAAGQHLCQVAGLLGITHVIDHPDAGLLSALGMGLAATGHVATRGIYKILGRENQHHWVDVAHDLKAECLARLKADVGASLDEQRLKVHFEFDCRYVGTETALSLLRREVDPAELSSLADQFHELHRQTYGYCRPERDVESVAVRCEAQYMSLATVAGETPPGESNRPGEADRPVASETTRVWSGDHWRDFAVHERGELITGQIVSSPAMIVSDHSTLLVQDGWAAVVGVGGIIEMHRSRKPVDPQADRFVGAPETDDPVALEVTARRLQGIADSMGEVLRRTAISVNVKERRDYSCAVFRHDGALVANAPHVPVHLGAMGHTVRHLLSVYPEMWPDDCYVSNDPFHGGSHLPDVTVVTPVFCDANRNGGRPDFFVASRAHHAEIGGLTPGSMPPLAGCLSEEGVLIRAFALFRDGKDASDELRSLLHSGPHPSRNPHENLADIEAQRAAGGHGARALIGLAGESSATMIDTMMARLIESAGDSLACWLEGVLSEPAEFGDRLDDATVIRVRMSKHFDSVSERHRLTIDFGGTDDVHPHGFNATPAIVTAAVLYVLRIASGVNLPLCDGLLRDVDLVLPTGLLNPPSDVDPAKCPAVVAGNVETSQRIVDVLLGALGIAAASQGTMNNFLIGDPTFGYYETIGGGSGATERSAGADAVHTHMTNTRITDPEILESRLPCRLHRFAIRRGSGGAGRHCGGHGMVREFEFLKSLTVSLITSRRTTAPYGRTGGQPGSPGRNVLIRDDEQTDLPPSVTLQVGPGDRIRIETPGGGGWGESDS